MQQQSPAITKKESSVPKVGDEDVAKTISFKLSKSPNNEYIVEQIVTARSPKYEYLVEQVTKSTLMSPPPSRDRNWPITPVKPKPATDNSNQVVMRGYNYVTSVVSPPKSYVRVPTSVKVQSAKPSSPTQCCNETSSDGQKLLLPETLQEYESAENLNESASMLLKQFAACENEVVYIDESANKADNLASMSQAELSEGCYNTRIAELIRNSYQSSAEASENEPISPTGATLPGADQFSPPQPMLYMPFCLDGPPSPILLSNTNPQGRLQILRSPKQPFYAHALGRKSDRPTSQQPASVLRKAIASYGPPMPTVLTRPGSIFKGFSPAEIARSLPIRSITDLHGSRSSVLGLREFPKRAASVSPQKSMIANIFPPTPSYILPSANKANIIPPTPSYILPSTNRQIRSGLRPKTCE